jgi:hypothetical protein
MPRTSAQDIRDQHLAAAIMLGQQKVDLATRLLTTSGWLAKRHLNADYQSAHNAQTGHIAFLLSAGMSSQAIAAALDAHNARER